MIKEKENLKTAIWIFLIIFVFIVEIIFYTWTKIQYTQYNYEISQQKKNKEKLLTMQNKLKVEFVRLKSPERIEIVAKQLNLIAPTQEQIVIMP